MIVDSAELHFLQIPMRVSVAHARAARVTSDSIVLVLRGRSGAAGFGEAIVREYVSGTLAGELDAPRLAAALVGRLLAPLRGAEHSGPGACALLAATSCLPQELPFLCAVETALLDLACAETGRDIYDVLGAPPLRDRLRYGGVMPLLPLEKAAAWMEGYLRFQFREVKVKLAGDPAYNDALLGICRDRLGPAVDLRADANSSWSPSTLDSHLAACARHAVRVVEQPFPAGADTAALRDARGRGFSFVADEGALDQADVDAIAAAGAFDILNLRLSKNGGLGRVRALAAAAERLGLRYQVGCMVGETAILSAMGRVAASLLPSPLYVEGSFDDLQLTDNVADAGMGFGLHGEAAVVRGRGLGCVVSGARVQRLTASAVPC
jgi:L-Ala-D/L-Glu epimerase